MKAKITDKSQLRLSDLTREYTFDIIDGEQTILSSQVINARPSEVITKLEEIIAEYETVFQDENDPEVGAEIG